jgi:TolB-like protein/tetratricopeptide (TPR) repeat protein
MADVFVSYKAEDRSRVAPLVQALEQDGFSVWWDAHIGGGDRWRETILKNLESAPCVIVVWSKRSTGPEGEFVRDEATRAKRRNAYLPVRIDKVDPPLGFGETQALPLHGWKGDPADGRYGAVLDAVRHRVGHDAHPAHPEQPKGVSRRKAIVGGTSVAVVVAAGAGAWWSSKGGAAGSSIAVLPFANLSGDPAQAYFSDGIAEELRSALARIAGLKVVARTSSEAVRNEDAKTAARKLDVAHILTGSVRRSAGTVRISAQLIDARDGTEGWSQDYDRPSGDALQIQSDIASRVASALALQLVPAHGGRLTLGGTNNARAHDLFLQGLAFRVGEHSARSMKSAIALFDQAIRLDPEYAEAYALKAQALSELGSGFAVSGAEMKNLREQAAGNADRALALSPDLPSAHAALASVAASSIDFARTMAQYRMAAAGNPDAMILDGYAIFLAQVGFTTEAHRMARRVIAIDPLNARSYVPDAQAFYSAHRFDDAVAAVGKLLLLRPGAPPALTLLGDSLLNLGKFDEARAAYEQIPAGDIFRTTSEGILDERMGKHEASEKAIQYIERTTGIASSYQLAQLHAQRGERDLAFAALDEALALPDPGLISLLVDPFIDPVRSDPRFAAIKGKINFPPGIPA